MQGVTGLLEMSAACQNNDKARGSTVLELIYAEITLASLHFFLRLLELLLDNFPPLHGGGKSLGEGA